MKVHGFSNKLNARFRPKYDVICAFVLFLLGSIDSFGCSENTYVQ